MVHTSLLANGLWSVSGIAQGVMAEATPLIFGVAVGLFSDDVPLPNQDGRWLQFNMIPNEELLSILLTALDVFIYWLMSASLP